MGYSTYLSHCVEIVVVILILLYMYWENRMFNKHMARVRENWLWMQQNPPQQKHLARVDWKREGF
jgi:hypothetical protein